VTRWNFSESPNQEALSLVYWASCDRPRHLNCAVVLQVAVDERFERFCVNPSVSCPEGLMVPVYRPAPPDAHETVSANWLPRMVPTNDTGPLPLSAVPVNSSCLCRRTNVMENPFD
jgi:hypothetical protein